MSKVRCAKPTQTPKKNWWEFGKAVLFFELTSGFQIPLIDFQFSSPASFIADSTMGTADAISTPLAHSRAAALYRADLCAAVLYLACSWREGFSATNLISFGTSVAGPSKNRTNQLINSQAIFVLFGFHMISSILLRNQICQVAGSRSCPRTAGCQWMPGPTEGETFGTSLSDVGNQKLFRMLEHLNPALKCPAKDTDQKCYLQDLRRMQQHVPCRKAVGLDITWW